MRNLIVALLLVTGCTKANPGYDAPTNDADMTTNMNHRADMADVDMANTDTDMVAANSPDMTQQITGDMAQADMANTAQPDMTSTDMQPSMYTHPDTFCGDSWTDNSASVNPALPVTADAACAACCSTKTGNSACTCGDSGRVVDQFTGNGLVDYVFFSDGTYNYRLYYYDTSYTPANPNYRVGKGIQILPSLGVVNENWWDQ